MTRAIKEAVAFLHHVALELEHTAHFDVLADKAKHHARRLEDEARSERECPARQQVREIRRILGDR